MLLQIKLVTTLGTEQSMNISDVNNYEFSENKIVINFNDPKRDPQTAILRSNDGLGYEDWAIVEIKANRVGLIPEGALNGQGNVHALRDGIS